MTTNAAILDESDPLIKYVGAWNEGGSPAEFNGTTKWSALQGSTASLSFLGTSIIVYGSVAARNPSQASLTFSVDGSISGTYTPPTLTADIHHEPLWMSPTLSSGSHDLVITQTAAQAEGVIFLDYIMYNTTSTSMPYFIDDRDPRITYTPPWTQEGSDQDFQHTVQRTSTTGDSFSLEFEGSSISFYGGITSQTINASAVIDGGPPTFFGAPSAATTTNDLLFSSGPLSVGTHKLVVTAENAEHVWADYFLVNPGAATSSDSTPSSASPSTPSNSGGTSSGTAPSVTPSASSKSTPIGAIVGPIVGALVLIVSVAVFFIYRRRRDRRRRSPTLPMSNVFEPTPFSGFVASGAAAPESRHGYTSVTTSNDSPAGRPNFGTLPTSTSTSTSNSSPFWDTMAHQPPAQTGAGVLPSNKLLREAERMRHDPPPALGTHSGSGPSSVAGSASARESQPPQYFE